MAWFKHLSPGREPLFIDKHGKSKFDFIKRNAISSKWDLNISQGYVVIFQRKFETMGLWLSYFTSVVLDIFLG